MSQNYDSKMLQHSHMTEQITENQTHVKYHGKNNKRIGHQLERGNKISKIILNF
jgi:hypothetical protein